MATEKKKPEILEEAGLDKEDTGSPVAQVVILTEEIRELFSHLEDHPKDKSSRKGLVDMVNKRRKLLKYLKEKDSEKYQKAIKKADLKK